MDVCSLALQALADCLIVRDPGPQPEPSPTAIPRQRQDGQPLRPATQPQPGIAPAPHGVSPFSPCAASAQPEQAAAACQTPPAPAQPTAPGETTQPPSAPLAGPITTEAAPRLSPLAEAARSSGASLSRRSAAMPLSPAAAVPSLPQRRPTSGPQLYHQRLAALQAGRQYTRIAADSYASQWQNPGFTPTYQQWQALLAREAAVMAASQGRNRLTILVGDSLTLWLPTDQLSMDRFWLNQSISGETTSQMRQRLHYFAQTQPTDIYVMAGINDLKNGASDHELLLNVYGLLRQLRQQHPQAHITVHSILPTRLPNLSSHRIHRLNQQIARLAQQQGIRFLDLEPTFADAQGLLRQELTTDGLHLSRQGYAVWQTAFLGR